MGKRSHFILVHGAGHGAWCWYKLASLLESAGHKVTAMDLTGCGIDSTSISEVKSVREYVKPLMEVMSALLPDERVVIVGHSLGGMSISFAIQAFPHKIAVAVFATAFICSPDSPLSESFIENYRRTSDGSTLLDSQLYFDEGPENLPTAVLFGEQLLTEKMYQLCPSEDVKLASKLMRPSKLFVSELHDSSLFTKERYGSVPKVYIKCTKDKILTENFQQWMINRASVTEVIEIDSDHMVMLSKPRELFDCLLEVTEKYI
ncbi:salicylic acid-binding protein 2-like [Dioscorea cayenensis subsp. rotundata]|uniref:Salicylic acid-binding protein 2-like n=1 Tax=Dioscorea cayennensis subsp. rotundata TaxID=55577 RepID=A0AB40B604_DIOCR|nr:salicylic acid-binding protein 2-like [Dioscorea cayenensis subsp. rotundata]